MCTVKLNKYCTRIAKFFNLSEVMEGASLEQGALKKHPLGAFWEQHIYKSVGQ